MKSMKPKEQNIHSYKLLALSETGSCVWEEPVAPSDVELLQGIALPKVEVHLSAAWVTIHNLLKCVPTKDIPLLGMLQRDLAQVYQHALRRDPPAVAEVKEHKDVHCINCRWFYQEDGHVRYAKCHHPSSGKQITESLDWYAAGEKPYKHVTYEYAEKINKNLDCKNHEVQIPWWKRWWR